MLVLTSLASGPKHGHALMKDVVALSHVPLGPGTLYGAIARLEERGLVAPLPADDRRRPYERRLRGFSRVWRARYGEELAALIEDLDGDGDLRGADRLDLLRAGLRTGGRARRAAPAADAHREVARGLAERHHVRARNRPKRPYRNAWNEKCHLPVRCDPTPVCTIVANRNNTDQRRRTPACSAMRR